MQNLIPSKTVNRDEFINRIKTRLNIDFRLKWCSCPINTDEKAKDKLGLKTRLKT